MFRFVRRCTRPSLHWLLVILAGSLWLSAIQPAAAQQAQPSGPVYIVQEGDTLWGIAARLGVSVDELQAANGINDPGAIRVGDALLIPGLEGVDGIITIEQVPFGETLRSLSRHYQASEAILIRLNRLSGPGDLYTGATIMIPKPVQDLAPAERLAVRPGQTVLELAALSGLNPWSLLELNQLPGAWQAFPGDVLRLPGDSSEGPGSLPAEIGAAVLEPLAFGQGQTGVITLTTGAPLSLTGSFLGHSLNFFPGEGGAVSALQGVYAMTVPGLYPMELQGRFEDGREFAFTQMVRVRQVDYPYDTPLTVDPATIDPAVTRPEDAQWTALAEPVTPEKYWKGSFLLPSPLEKDYCLETGECWSSRYGNRRSYNGSAYLYFHTGLDVVGQTGVEIYAPAGGVVVFTGPLTVRGNATMINHGQGVYTGYMHQSEILVQPGDFVKAGQLIGRVGGTGRVQGPHLHWEVWVGGVQVDPLEWLESVYP
ncbi:MAG: peptidoglycan DD-metalloendopeptidase family protein [Anaerolineales bacterium]|jgi:murein DD-endopeptidase MepM/ murein hydrolase activator NlpD|nr:peptidoglycan DD-metalloendopeptidase family protein [Anaerolineales bacterium]